MLPDPSVASTFTRNMATKVEIVRRVEGLFALADQLELRVAGQVDHLAPLCSPAPSKENSER